MIPEQKWARWVAVVVLLIAFFGGALVAKQLIFSGAAVKSSQGQTRQQAIAANVFTLINAQRKKAGLSVFKRDPALDRIAQAHSHDMLVRNYFAHDAPGGPTFAERFHSITPRRALGEENIAYGGGSYGSAAGLVSLWMNSPPHRANILNPSVHRIGIGISIGFYQGQPASTIGTQDFSN